MIVAAENLRMLMDTFYGMRTDIVLKCEDDKIKALSVDPSRVMLADVAISYDGVCDWPEETVALEMTRVRRVLPKAGEVEIKVTDSRIEFKSSGKRIRTRKLSLEYPDMSIPELNYTVHGVMSAGDFRSLVSDAGVISDAVVFEAKNGDAIAKVTGTIDEIEVEFSATGEGRGKYAVSYLSQVADVVGKYFKDTVVGIEIGTNIPIRLKATKDDAECVWVIAPRIEDEL